MPELCVLPVDVPVSQSVNDCCQLTMACGTQKEIFVPRIALTIPALNIFREFPTWQTKNGFTEFAPTRQLTSVTTAANAAAQAIPPGGGTGRVDVAVTASMLSPAGICLAGFRDNDASGMLPANADYAMGVKADGHFVVYVAGAAAYTGAAAVAGDSFAVVVQDAEVLFLVNGAEVHSTPLIACGALRFNVYAAVAGQIVGGYDPSAVVSIATAGIAAQVGTVAGNIYTAPGAGGFSDIELEVTAGAGTYTLQIHIGLPTPKITNPQAIEIGVADLWVLPTSSAVLPGQYPKFAHGPDGLTPDKGVHPNAVFLGSITADGIKVMEKRDLTAISDQFGVVRKRMQKEEVKIELTFQETLHSEVRKITQPGTSVTPIPGGVRVGFGGGICECEYTVWVLKDNGACGGSGFMFKQLHRVNIMSEPERIYRATGGDNDYSKFKLTAEAMYDKRWPAKQQLYIEDHLLTCGQGEDECA